MPTAITSICLLAGLLVSTFSHAASAVHKCEINGSITYQSSPCPSGETRQRPTAEQLNAERKRRAASAPAEQTGPQATGIAAPTMQPSPSKSFRCDGRTHCSQMTSCAEAKYFLSNCPGVKMDGDRNGIPCERQWCNP
jgi:hypothetical protein